MLQVTDDEYVNEYVSEYVTAVGGEFNERLYRENSSLMIHKMTTRYAFTPLKMIAKELITLHYDLDPTEICPGMNRPPSFIGNKDEDDGLMSGRCSPKLDIPRRRYCGRMIHQHPLVKYCYKMSDRRLAHLIKKHISSSSSTSSFDDDSDSENDKEQKKRSFIKPMAKLAIDAILGKQEDKDRMPISKENSFLEMFTKNAHKRVKKPIPFAKPSGYLEIYKKKANFSKNKVLPPIGSQPPEEKQPAPVLMPTPPSQPPPTNGQSATMRSVRKARMENRQQKYKVSGIGKV